MPLLKKNTDTKYILQQQRRKRTYHRHTQTSTAQRNLSKTMPVQTESIMRLHSEM